MPPEGGAAGHMPPETGQRAWNHYRASLLSPWYRVPTVRCSTHWAWGCCGVWEAGLPHTTSSAPPQRRNGRACSSLTARGGGLPFGVMADHRLDAIVHKAVEHQPTRIADGVNPPFVDQKGAPHLNTFLVFVPSIVVPAGFTRDNLPAGITFVGRPYDDGTMIKIAYAYEQATHHRRPPASTTPL